VVTAYSSPNGIDNIASLCPSDLKSTTNAHPSSPTDSLDKTKVTGVEPIDKAQDGVNNLVTGQLGKGGALQGVGDTFSKEGVNRAERGGKDDSVSFIPHPSQRTLYER